MSGLRGLRDPRCDAVVHAGARHRARAHGLRVGHRVRGAVSLLHEHVRHALDPRPRSGDRNRPRGVASRSFGVGRDRRRRCALDRRQPSDPCAAPQRERQDPALQQQDLRLDEGPVLPDERAREGDEVDADGLTRLPVQPVVACDRCRGDLRRAVDRHRQGGHDGRAARSGTAQGHARSSRSSRTARSSTTTHGRSCATTRKA